MKNFLVKFITLDGNNSAVYISASSDSSARRIFEREYMFSEIISCEEDNAEIVIED